MPLSFQIKGVEMTDNRHPKYMHAHQRRRLGLTWAKPKWVNKKRKRIREEKSK